MDFAFIVIVVILIVTLVGHGLWSLFAWMFRGLRRRGVHGAYEPTLDDDRAATARYLSHLRAGNLIDEQVHARFINVIAQEVAGAHKPPVRASVEGKRKVLEDLYEAYDEMDMGNLPDAPATPPPAAPVDERAIPSPPKQHVTETIPHITKRQVLPSPSQPPSLAQPAETTVEPRRSWSEVLAGFMAEKNIRWGELVGGLLIVGSSTALVISLWSHIAAIPMLKFVIFTAVTAALFGAGLFVHHRWNLATTGYALLVISTLIVPLNLLAFAAFSPRGALGSAGSVVAELAAIGLFAWLTLLAGRVVLARASMLFAGGVVGLSVSSLVVRIVSPSTESALVAVAAIPVALYLVVVGIPLWRQTKVQGLSDDHAVKLILQLGVQSFACLVPLGLLVYETEQGLSAIRLLSPIVCALSAPALITGLFVWRRFPSALSPQWRTAGTSIAVGAAAIMLAGAVLAWPTPVRLLPVLLVNGAAMVALSRLARHPLVGAAGAVWFAAAWLVAFHSIRGAVSWVEANPHLVLSVLWSAASGQALVAVVVACLGLAILHGRRQRPQFARGYGLTALAFAAVSVAMVTVCGFGIPGDAAHITWVYLFYAAIGFAVAQRLRAPVAAYAGCVLAQMALAQWLVYVRPIAHYAGPTSLLIGATCCTLAGIVLHRMVRIDQSATLYREPLNQFAVIISAAAAVWIVATLPIEPLSATAVRAAWIFLLWLVLAYIDRRPVVFAGAQVALALGASATVQHYLRGLDWYQALPSPWQHPWIWQAHFLALGASCLLWGILRFILHRAGAMGEVESPSSDTVAARPWTATTLNLLNPGFPPADRWFSDVALVGLAALSAWSVWAGVVAEHGWRMFRAPIALHELAGGVASWYLLAMLVVVAALRVSRGSLQSAITTVMIAALCGSALVASRFEDTLYVVTAWRWCLAVLFFAVLAAHWSKRYWLNTAQRLLFPHTPVEAPTWVIVRHWSITLFAIPALILTGTYAFAVALGYAHTPPTMSTFTLRVALVGPVVLIAAALFGQGRRERRSHYALMSAIVLCATVAATEICLQAHTGGRIQPVFVVWLVQVNAVFLAAVAILWQTTLNVRQREDAEARFATWPLMVVRIALGFVLFWGAPLLWIGPQAAPTVFREVGTAWGFAAVVLVESALLMIERMRIALVGGRRLTTYLVFCIVLTASALSRLDTGNWLCFHVLIAGCAVSGWLVLYMGARHIRQMIGSGWRETFDVASAAALGDGSAITHDLACVTCSYNLRGLSPTGNCPECNASIASSLEGSLGRLSREWASLVAQQRAQTGRGVLALTLLVGILAARTLAGDPQHPWWAAGSLLCCAANAMALAAWAPRRSFAYVGGIAVCLATSVWWIAEFWRAIPRGPSGRFVDLAHVNVTALAVAGGAWLWIERRILARKLADRDTRLVLPFHHVAAIACTTAITALTGFTMYFAFMGWAVGAASSWRWLSWFAATALMLGCAARPTLRHVSAGLYTLGLAAICMIATELRVQPPTLVWVLSLSLAGYAALTGLFHRSGLGRGTETSEGRTPESWFRYASGFLVIVSLLLAIGTSLTHMAFGIRLLMMLSPVLCGTAFLVGPATGRQTVMRNGIPALAATSLVLLSWAFVSPVLPVAMLHRAVGVVAAMAVTLLAIGLAPLFMAPDQPWVRVLRDNVVAVTVTGAIALLYCTACETNALLQDVSVRLANPAIVTLIVALTVAIACLTAFALHHRVDPFQLPARKKDAYIYAAEVLAAIIGLHIRATMPWLFHGLITQYWPLLVLGLAVVAAVVADIAERRGVTAIAVPLRRSGLCLPAVATLDFFLAASVVNSAVVLLLAGAIYAVLAARWRSSVLGLVAAVAFNGSLWCLLHQMPGLGLLRHPQLWLVPPAMAVLVAAHLNRARLAETQRKMIHYACLLVVYLSSTADIVLIGVANAPWLPLVLGGLSVAGIFVGIAFRFRSFLQLSVGFLCLALLTIVWHAATNLGWTWVWYVAGLVLGIGIITVFALFEKKRNEMTALLDNVRGWTE